MKLPAFLFIHITCLASPQITMPGPDAPLTEAKKTEWSITLQHAGLAELTHYAGRYLGFPPPGQPVSPVTLLAREELQRRSISAEQLILELEAASSGRQEFVGYLSCLGTVLEISPSQKQRVMNLIRLACAEHEQRQPAQTWSPAARSMRGVTAFLAAHPGRQSEDLLLKLAAFTDEDIEFLAFDALAESGSASALAMMQAKLHTAEETQKTNPGHPYPVTQYSRAVETLEGRIRSGAAPAFFPDPPAAALAATGGPGRRPSGGEAAGFWKEPYVWLAAVLLAGAGGVWVWRRRGA